MSLFVWPAQTVLPYLSLSVVEQFVCDSKGVDEKPADVRGMKPAAISFCCPFAAFDFYEKKPESVPRNDLSLHFQLYGHLWLLLLKKKCTWWLALKIRCHGCRERLQIPSLFAIKQGKKCWALSLSAVLPEAAGSQDPQVFSRSPTPVENPPFPPRRLTSVARSCCFSPLQIRLEGHCEMSALFRKALMYTDQHPAIIQSRCHLSVSLKGFSVVTPGLTPFSGSCWKQNFCGL